MKKPTILAGAVALVTIASLAMSLSASAAPRSFTNPATSPRVIVSPNGKDVSVIGATVTATSTDTITATTVVGSTTTTWTVNRTIPTNASTTRNTFLGVSVGDTISFNGTLDNHIPPSSLRPPHPTPGNPPTHFDPRTRGLSLLPSTVSVHTTNINDFQAHERNITSHHNPIDHLNFIIQPRGHGKP